MLKIDRLLALSIYLLNRKKVSARELAERFGVSERTIQRDIQTLCIAGIPVFSTYGANGGYEMMDTFRMERQAAVDSDYAHIVAALKGLASASGNPRIEDTLEKFNALMDKKALRPTVHLDLSVLREQGDMEAKLVLLEKAIVDKRVISFSYTDSTGRTTQREAEPAALVCRWYSWYLLGFCRIRQDYRQFKLGRINNLEITKTSFTTDYPEASVLLEQLDSNDTQSYMRFKVRGKAEIRALLTEYVNGQITDELPDGDFIMEAHLPEGEQVWFGILLAAGNKAVVLEPDELRQRLLDKARELQAVYNL